MEQKTRDPKKDFKIFAILNSLQWDFNKDILKKNINLISEVLSLLSVNNPIRKGLKRSRTSLSCIRNAFDRYDHQILEKDYNNIKEDVLKSFQLFQLNTGITKLPEQTIKEIKQEIEKPKKLNSLADLVAWKENIKKSKEERLQAKEKAKLEKEILEKAKEKAQMPLLKTSRTLYEETLSNSDSDITFCFSSLVVSGYVENPAKFEYLGVVMEHTKFGFTWSNQLIAIVKKNPKNTKELILSIAEEKFGQKYQILYSPIQHPDFKNYLFYWLISSNFLAQAGLFTVNHFYLPLEYPNIKSKKQLLTTKELSEAREKIAKFKKEKQMPQLDQCRSLVDFRVYLQMVYVGKPLTQEIVCQAQSDLDTWVQLMNFKEPLIIEPDFKRNILNLVRQE